MSIYGMNGKFGVLDPNSRVIIKSKGKHTIIYKGNHCKMFTIEIIVKEPMSKQDILDLFYKNLDDSSGIKRFLENESQEFKNQFYNNHITFEVFEGVYIHQTSYITKKILKKNAVYKMRKGNK